MKALTEVLRYMPEGALRIGAVAEYHWNFVSILNAEESLHMYVRHTTLNPVHFIASIAKATPESEFRKVFSGLWLNKRTSKWNAAYLFPIFLDLTIA